MKKIVPFLVVSVALLIGGVYTQFAASNDEPEVVVETSARMMIHPLLPTITLDLEVYPSTPVYHPLPAAGDSTQNGGSKESVRSTRRDFGTRGRMVRGDSIAGP